MTSVDLAETFVTIFNQCVNSMFEKNPNISLEEVQDKINLPKFLSCLSERDQKRNLVPFTELIEEIYHNIKAGGTEDIQCVVNFDDEKEEVIKLTPEECGKGFVNSFYQKIISLLKENPASSFEEACARVKLSEILEYSSEESKVALTAMIEEIYNSAKIGAGIDDIKCVLLLTGEEESSSSEDTEEPNEEDSDV